MGDPRVMVLAADVGGCGHYRVGWPGEALQVAGFPVEVVWPDEPRSRFELLIDRVASREAGRPVTLPVFAPGAVPEADVVVLQRPLTGMLVNVVRALQAAGVRVVVEVDDDFETIDPANIAHRSVSPRWSPDRNWQHLREVCRLADWVVVTTPALAARYGKHGRVSVVPNMVPRRYLYQRPSNPLDRFAVGWSGSIDTHPRDLQVTRGAVAQVLAERGLIFHLVGSGRRLVDDGTGRPVEVPEDRVAAALRLPVGSTWAHTGRWLTINEYPAGLAMLDVGIVPLAGGAFNEAKSWLKGLEMAAVGVPFVCSPTGPYRDLVAAGAGRVADHPREWRRELVRLIDDAEWRAEVAAAGRAAARGLVIEDHADRWWSAWSAPVCSSVPSTSKVLL